MNCDKCGKEVLAKDDATFLESYVMNDPMIILVNYPRHILCSPSNAQYILDLNVVDDRPEYDKRLKDKKYVVEQEKLHTDAYHKLQQRKD